MVEITPNFERLRTELDLPMTFEQLGSSISVSTARNTNLMLIKASLSDREKAASSPTRSAMCSLTAYRRSPWGSCGSR